ncbi:MAG: TlpA family protein disulfide reductase [Arenicella sp.]|nr:TlpA family protein disulfide reductase [Arenicella sp.]
MKSNMCKRTALCAVLLLQLFCAPMVLAEDKLDLSEYAGRVVYVDFWASWCIPCEKSFPFMNRLHRRFKDKGLTVIAVNVEANRAKAERFLERHPAKFKVVYDSDGSISEQYELQGLPHSFLFDRDGSLVGSHLGFRIKDADALSAEIKSLLEKTPVE